MKSTGILTIALLFVTLLLSSCVQPQTEKPISIPEPTSSPPLSAIEPSNRTVTERLILQNAPSAVVISPDGQRTAYLSSYLNDEYIVVDGVESKLNHSVKPNSLVFSPNSQRLVYVAYEGSKYFVVADGIESGPYRHGMLDRGPPNPQFSPDSQHLVYVADRNRVILDGV